MADYKIYLVKCPFFLEWRNSEPNRIKCEGLSADSSIHVVFKRSRITHYNAFCCDKYTQCPIYKMLNEKYNKI